MRVGESVAYQESPGQTGRLGRSEFCFKKLKDALEADTGKDHTTILDKGVGLIKQRNKLLVNSGKYG